MKITIMEYLINNAYPLKGIITYFEAYMQILWAHGVGSFDRDELLVPDGKQVNIKYLYEFMPQE